MTYIICSINDKRVIRDNFDCGVSELNEYLKKYAKQNDKNGIAKTWVAILERLTDLKNRIEESLPYISLTSQTARREFLIAPVIMELIHYTHAKVRVEYGLNINNQLKGVIDYYIKADNQLLVIEAKNGDLERGVVQLAVELIAFDNWSPIDNPILYGAVSIGNIWQFVILHRESKEITQDLNLYRVPNDLETLMKILVALMKNL